MAGEVHVKQFEFADQEALLSFLRLAYPGEPRKSELVRMINSQDM